MNKEEIEFTYDAGMSKSIDFVFNMSTSYTSWDKAIRLIDSHRVDVAPLITHTGPLEKWEEFFTILESKKGIKTVLIP